MELVRRSLQDSEEKATQRKNFQKSLDGKIMRERTKADISIIQLEQQDDEKISSQRAQLDKTEGKEFAEAAKRIEKEQIAQLKKALSDQRALFERMIAEERAIANEGLRKTRQANDASKNKERETFDSLINQLRAQVEELENDRLRLKGIIEKLIPSIEENESRRNTNFQVPYGMICMLPTYFQIAVDNTCPPGVAMKFKVFKLKEIWPDLQKYDLRADLGVFGIEGTSVVYAKFMKALLYQGYIYDAEVYYLNPAPGSEPPTGLVKIVEEDDVNKMVLAHDKEGMKICLLYLVTSYEGPGDYMDTYMADEQAAESSDANVVPSI